MVVDSAARGRKEVSFVIKAVYITPIGSYDLLKSLILVLLQLEENLCSDE